MSHPLAVFSSLRRPRLLIRAARFGLADYNRARHLRRLFDGETAPSPAQALDALLVKEQQLEATRKAGDATYSVARHVEVLIAMIAEARLIPEQSRG